MNRTELVEKIATTHGLTKTLAAEVLSTTLETIQLAVKKGDPVQLVGFGTFKSTKRAARTGKYPKTGEALKIAAAIVPRFVPGSAFKDIVDPKNAKKRAEKKAAK